MAAAVCSMRRSGRRPPPRAYQPAAVSSTSSSTPLITFVVLSLSTAASASASGAAATIVQSWPAPAFATARQRDEPSAPSMSTALPSVGTPRIASPVGRAASSTRDEWIPRATAPAASRYTRYGVPIRSRPGSSTAGDAVAPGASGPTAGACASRVVKDRSWVSIRFSW
jgi:hypothetical protein